MNNKEKEKLAKELLDNFRERYKHSPSVMKTIEKVINEVLKDGDDDGTA